MFGPDTALVVDALQMAGLALLVGAGGTWLLLRRRKANSKSDATPKKHDLEDRVRVLERIATDRTTDLADEIEALREAPKVKELN